MLVIPIVWEERQEPFLGGGVLSVFLGFVVFWPLEVLIMLSMPSWYSQLTLLVIRVILFTCVSFSCVDLSDDVSQFLCLVFSYSKSAALVNVIEVSGFL